MSVAPKTEATLQKSQPDVGPLVEIIKAVAFISGSLGSLAVLFLWIGNAIIVARLRVYHLYGMVRYTDDYIKEAGYQFLQDIFTFFEQPELVLIFILALLLVFLLVPIGPYRKAEGNSSVLRWLFKGNYKLKDLGRSLVDIRVQYFFFLMIALFCAIVLISNFATRLLTTKIISQERYLSQAQESLEEPIFFVKRAGRTPNGFQKRFYEQFVSRIKLEDPSQTLPWLMSSLSQVLNTEVTEANLKKVLDSFQSKFKINEKDILSQDSSMFNKSETYRQLYQFRLNMEINELVVDQVKRSLSSLRNNLSGHLDSELDYSNLVVIPSSYNLFNKEIIKLKKQLSNIFFFFSPGDLQTQKVIRNLKRLETVECGGVLLTFSFWMLIGLLIYLLLNFPNFLKFAAKEKVYFLFMLLLFLIIAVALPSTYGRYKFEFRVQKINNIIFKNESKEAVKNSIQTHIQGLFKEGMNLYVLGPTKGQEVIIGAIHPGSKAITKKGRIIVLEKDLYNYMSFEPVSSWEIRDIINLLRERAINSSDITG